MDDAVGGMDGHGIHSVNSNLLLDNSEICERSHPTYWHRVDDPDSYNFCPVEEGTTDAFLFASLAIIIASLLHFSRMSAVLVLFMGSVIEVFVYKYNLGRIGNAFTVWLGVSPPEILLYGFLPPLLLDAAMGLDWFVFTKVARHAIVYAFLVVVSTAGLMTPFMLHVLNLGHWGWTWPWAALFISTVASTDALAVSAIIKGACGPEDLTVLMEGESLLNDATSLVLFSVLFSLCKSNQVVDLSSVLPKMAIQFTWLALGGCLVGLLFGWLTLKILRLMRTTGASRPRELGLVQGMALLTFYVASSPLNVSGVIAVVVFGLYGAATSKFELANTDAAIQLDGVQSTLGSALNGIVFFLGGASATNFLIRAAPLLENEVLWTFICIPVIYVMVFIVRGASISVFNYLFGFTRQGSIAWSSIPFITLGGLRGALSLIMAMQIASEAYGKDVDPTTGKIIAQIVTWASSFVLLTLLINAPSLPWLLRSFGLLNQSEAKKKVVNRVKRALEQKTKQIIEDLKADEDEMFRGVDWMAVQDFSQENINPSSSKKQSFWRVFVCVAKKINFRRGGAERECRTPVPVDIEEPLIQEDHPLQDLQMDENFKQVDNAAEKANKETPFILKSVENKDATAGMSKVSSSSQLEESNASLGWSSPPAEALRPSESELHTWWGTAEDGGGAGQTSREQIVSASPEALLEARTRLIWGIKRYIFAKRHEGLLSPNGSKTLAYACDTAIENVENPLDIWSSVNKELVERVELQAAAWVFHSARMLVYSSPGFAQPVLSPIIKFATSWLGVYLGKAMLKSCEVAIAYYMALCFSKQSQWLQSAHKDSLLHLELILERDRVYQFIIDREIEAPAHFEAMQTYRAEMAVILRQMQYIDSIFNAGVINDIERERLVSPIVQRKQVLEVTGPSGSKWQSSGNVLLSLPIYRDLDDESKEIILQYGAMKEFGGGEIIWESSREDPDYAFCIIVRGLIKSVSADHDDSISEEYLGSGAMLGILPAITENKVHLPGWKHAVAQSSRLQKGVLVFFFPTNVLKAIKMRARQGEAQFQKMLLNIERECAMYILSAMKEAMMDSIATRYEQVEKERHANLREFSRGDGKEVAGLSDQSTGDERVEDTQIKADARKYALKIENLIRRQIPQATTTVLEPYQTFVQRSHIILLSGSIQRHGGGAASKKLKSSISMGTKLTAPCVVPLLHSQYNSDHAEVKPYLSGHEGAVLIVCPRLRSHLGSSEGGSNDHVGSLSFMFGDSVSFDGASSRHSVY